MRKIFTEVAQLFFANQRTIDNPAILTKQLLKRDLENCLTIADIEGLSEVLKYCNAELSKDEFLTFLLNIGYRKQIINFCDQHLICKRYPAHEIKAMFNRTNSLAFCDAVLLHVKRNSKYYTSEFQSLPAMNDTSVFERMAEKKQADLYNKFLSQTPI